MQLTDWGPPIDEFDILAFERRVGVTLPASYRRFLLEVNGGDGPDDASGYPPDRFHSLHWSGGPVSDRDLAAYRDDPLGWSGAEYGRDLEFAVRGLWHSGLPRVWLPVGGVNHEDLLLLRLDDGSVWQMNLGRGWFDEDACTRVAGSFDELGVSRA